MAQYKYSFSKEMNREERLQWALNLKPGDVVCDCRFRHLPIKAIAAETDFKWFPFWLYFALPNFAASLIDKFWPFCRFIDQCITFEDGSSCGALSCCDPVGNHQESDHGVLTDGEYEAAELRD